MLCDVPEGVEAEIWQQPPLQSPFCCSFPSHCLGSFFGVSDISFWGCRNGPLLLFFLVSLARAEHSDTDVTCCYTNSASAGWCGKKQVFFLL